MNIGILTYHFSNNYGAVLQTYALQSKLRMLGHATIIIGRTPVKTDIIHKLYYLFNSNSSFFWRHFRRFGRKQLQPITETYLTDEQLRKGIKDYHLDAIIVGSDQIWRGTLCGYSYFLTFLPDDSSIRRISYAASFGLEKWDASRRDTALIRDALSKFHHVSVRETSGVGICKEIFGIDAKLVVDPTLLHNASFYELNILKQSAPGNSHKVVSYILGKQAVDMVKSANQFARDKGLPQSELYWLTKDLKGLKLKNIESRRRHITVREWLSEIRDAEYVVTNSFHCVVFSILFKKKFVVFEYAVGGNDRLATLLSALGLKNRIISPKADIKGTIEQEIDYELCSSRLAALRDSSELFLRDALSGD